MELLWPGRTIAERPADNFLGLLFQVVLLLASPAKSEGVDLTIAVQGVG